jgi:transposase
MFPPLPGYGRRSHTVIGVVVAARRCCVRDFCVGAGVIAAVLDTTRRSPNAMVTPPDIEAQILRYYHAEKWTAGTIARQLHVHHSVVRRVLAQAGLPRIGPAKRPSPIDAYLPLIRQTLEKFPTLTASRLFTMAHERGYRGSPDHFRHLVAEHRPRRPAEAFLRLRSLPGEQAQVDWGHFGHLQIGRARRPLMAFVMVLSHSRQIFLRFYLDARMENFLRGHVGAFTAWNGVPRVLLYDNLKSAVLERRGDAIRFHPSLLGFAGHYRYEPRPVAVARGNEKGRVERSIGYIRGAFFAARSFADLDDLNAQADDWCRGLAADRRCPGEPDRTVREVFAEEARHLLSLPDDPAPLLERVAVKVGKTPYVRFDLNDYSVPHTHVRRTLTVLADIHELRVADGAQVIALHRRSYDRGAQIEQTEHLQALIDQKHAARQHRATDRLAQVAPASRDLLVRAAERGANLGAITHGLTRLLDRYGAADLQAAIREALERDVPHPNAVRLALERRRELRGEAPPIDIDLPADVRARDAPVQPHALETYDELKDLDDE